MFCIILTSCFIYYARSMFYSNSLRSNLSVLLFSLMVR